MAVGFGKIILEVSVFKSALWIILTLFLAACAATNPQASQPAQEQVSSLDNSETVMETKPLGDEVQPVQADLEDLGPAPELENGVWLNTDQPLRLEDLRGKVILLDMWTFG